MNKWLRERDRDEKGATEDEFIERAKKFVSQPDAKEHVKELVDATFQVMDANKNGVVSYEEFLQFHKALTLIKKQSIWFSRSLTPMVC